MRPAAAPSVFQPRHALDDHGKLVTAPTVTADAIREAAGERGLQAAGYVVEPDTEQLDEILALLGRGDVNLHISAAYPLANAINFSNFPPNIN